MAAVPVAAARVADGGDDVGPVRLLVVLLLRVRVLAVGAGAAVVGLEEKRRGQCRGCFVNLRLPGTNNVAIEKEERVDNSVFFCHCSSLIQGRKLPSH